MRLNLITCEGIRNFIILQARGKRYNKERGFKYKVILNFNCGSCGERSCVIESRHSTLYLAGFSYVWDAGT
jgi:hypothetical protein